MNDYQKLANEYDAYFDTKNTVLRHKDFFRSLINKYKIKSCLDCACGTGWHLRMLQATGVQCAGSDRSARMLQCAKKNLQGMSIPLKREDYRYLPRTWNRKFDMVICMTTGFAHMLTDKDAIRALHSMYGCLNDGGILVISNGISDATFKNRPRLIPGNIQRNRAMYFFLEYPTAKRIVFNVIRIAKTRNGFDHALDRVEYNAMQKKDFDRFFRRTSFHNIEYFGDHKFSSFSLKNSGRIVIVAQK